MKKTMERKGVRRNSTK